MNEQVPIPRGSEPVRAQLAAAGVETRIVVLPDSAHTAKAAATAIGCPLGAIASSLLFVIDEVPTLVMTSGAHRVDTEVMAQELGAESVAMANAKQVRSVTGQVIGGVAPIGHPQPVPTVIDRTLAEFDPVWSAAGHPHTVMALSFEQLRELTGGRVISVA